MDLRFQISRPLTRISRATPSDPGGPPVEEIVVSMPESTLSRSVVKGCTAFSLRSVRKSKTSWNSAGLFEDCSHAFFHNDSKISVWKLGDLEKLRDLEKQITSPSFFRVFDRHELILYVAPCRSYIVVATDKRHLVFDIRATTPIDVTSHVKWTPSGLACHENETHVVVFLGECQRNERNKYNGRIRVLRYDRDNPRERLPPSILAMPANDSPKRLSFHADSRILTCITRLQNKILVWRFDDFSSSLEPPGPSEFLKNNYTAVRTRDRGRQSPNTNIGFLGDGRNGCDLRSGL